MNDRPMWGASSMPRLPWPEAEIDRRGVGRPTIVRLTGLHDRSLLRWKQRGLLPLEAADVLAVRVLGVHPSAVWGQAWWDALDRQVVLDIERVRPRRQWTRREVMA